MYIFFNLYYRYSKLIKYASTLIYFYCIYIILQYLGKPIWKFVPIIKITQQRNNSIASFRIPLWMKKFISQTCKTLKMGTKRSRGITLSPKLTPLSMDKNIRSMNSNMLKVLFHLKSITSTGSKFAGIELDSISSNLALFELQKKRNKTDYVRLPWWFKKSKWTNFQNINIGNELNKSKY